MNPIEFDFDGSFSESLIRELVDATAVRLEDFELQSFLLGCSFPYILTEDEKQLLKKQFQFDLTKRLEQKLGVLFDNANPSVSITIDFNSRQIQFWIAPVYFSGRYNKFSRQIGQTTFFCPKCKGKGCKNCGGKGKLGLQTVEELIGNAILPLFNGSGFAFHGAGREDVDVRMLGKGRPFVMEIKEPQKRTVDLKKIEQAVNNSPENKNAEKIKIFDLAFATKAEVAKTKEERHQKKYLALVSCERPLDSKRLSALNEQSVLVKQQTPLRVLARRSDLIRERQCQIQSVKPLSESEFEIVLITEAGLYVKEFVSGEQGRSQPSLSGLLQNRCECKQLDVLKILDSG